MPSVNRLQLACWTFAAVTLIAAPLTTFAVDGELATAIEEAKTKYQPVSPEELETQREELAAAATELETLLIPGSDRGERWKRYLKWEGVKKNIDNPADPDLQALAETLDKLRSGADGTELPAFRRVREAIDRYLSLVNIGRVNDQQRAVARQLELLTKYLDRYESEPSARARYEIERRLEFFSSIDRTPKLNELLNERFGHANLQTQISETIINKLLSEPVDNNSPVNDCILGTSIHGTGWTTASVSIDLMPNDEKASLKMTLEGVTQSQTVGYNGPVVIRSSGTTPFTATKRLDFEDSNFWNYPAQVSATTRTVTQSVQKQGGGIGSRLISAIGERQVAEKKPQADAIASRHAEQRIAENMDDELLPKLQDARYEYLHSFKEPMADRDAEPGFVHFSSTDDALNVELLQAARGQLGADTTPEGLSAAYDVTVNLHETAVANIMTTYLGGATVEKATATSEPKLDVTLPEAVTKAIDKAREEREEQASDDTDEFKPWSMQLRRQRPVTIEFLDNQVRLRLHATRLTAGDSTYDGWDIVTTYGMQVEDGGLTLVREGEIEVFPTAFDPADGKGLSGREVGLRGNLAKELNRQAESGRGFPKEINLPTLELPERIADKGPLLMQEAKSGNGWLSIGWNLPE
ncbi:hypothetical protein [Aeoliella mucimassa]|uniref:Secreted protein n=1 Tax=Aeoliella mucimassa TaxID=2527972 RepID=A0A518AVW0_9BACT|nr:hypothetical protein [Aeoliella mucimassa]QDU58869.1 hypothetical protein Pan181_51090 [Aeoliella mucimassa]